MELLGRKTIRAIVFEPASDAEIAQARAVENLHRQDITPLEEVQAVSDVLEAIKSQPKFTGDPYEEAATRLARSVQWVRDRDYLHRLTRHVQRFAVQSGLPAGHLRELAKVGDPHEQMRLACESAGAPPWAFPATEKDAGIADHQKQLQDGYFAELSDGKVQRWPLSRLKAEVAKVQFSLKVIPWQFDKPVTQGDVKLRRCAGCPHNSETDRLLFGVEEDAANPRGFCLNAACYNAKHAAADAAKEQVLKRIGRQKVQTPEAIRKLAPDWLKETTVVGFVRRQLDKAERHEDREPHERSGNGRSYGRELTEHEKALRQFARELDQWQETAFAKLLAAINAEPLHRVSWCVLLGVPALWDHPRIEVPHVNEYGQPSTGEPVIPDVPEELAKAIALAFKATRSAWVELLSRHEQSDPDRWGGFRHPHPRVLQLIAEAVGVKLPTLPKWDPLVQPPPTSASELAAAVAA